MRILSKTRPISDPGPAPRWGAALSVLCFSLALSACGGGDSATPAGGSATPEPAAGSARPAAAPVVPIPPGDAAERGEAALREQRLFVPAGDNAFELFLAAVEARPEDERSRLALQDLLPYAALHVEQRLAANDADEAERVLDLLARASSDAPALPRLRAGLAALREREASTRAAAANAAPSTKLATAPVAAPVPSVANPTPDSARSVPDSAVASEPGPPASAAAPKALPPEPSPAALPPPQPVTTPAPQRVPEVVYRPPLRYPPMAERRKLEGFVEIEFTIGTDGSVSQLEILRSEPEGVFDREALTALQRWRFAPPQAPLRARRTLEFKLAR